MRAWLALPLLVACTGNATPTPEVGPDPQASAAGAKRLCYVFQHVGAECRASQDLVEVGDVTLKVDATIRHQVDLPGGAARNVAFEVHSGGKVIAAPIEILGKGNDPADAVDRAASDWAAMAGTAIVDASRDDGTSSAVIAALKAGRRSPEGLVSGPIAVGPFHAYPGIPEIRGAMAGGPKVDHAGLLGAAVSHLSKLDADTPHTVLFSVQNDGTATCEKARVDGKPDSTLCGIAAAWGWPTPASPYQVRQVYILKPGPVPASPAASDTDADSAGHADTDSAAE